MLRVFIEANYIYYVCMWPQDITELGVRENAQLLLFINNKSCFNTCSLFIINNPHQRNTTQLHADYSLATNRQMRCKIHSGKIPHGANTIAGARVVTAAAPNTPHPIIPALEPGTKSGLSVGCEIPSARRLLRRVCSQWCKSLSSLSIARQHFINISIA